MTRDEQRAFERMRHERDEAIEELKQLRDAMCPPVTLPKELGLTHMQERLLIVLTQQDIVSYKGLKHLMRTSEDVDGSNLVSVHLCHLRKRLGDRVKIETVYGRGLRLLDRQRWADLVRSCGATAEQARRAA